MKKQLKIKSINFYHDPDDTGVAYEANDDEEVCVTLEDGRQLYCWFFTLDKIKTIMMRHRLSGESNKGTYFWATNMIVIEKIDKDNMIKTLRHLIEKDNDLSLFDEV